MAPDWHNNWKVAFDSKGTSSQGLPAPPGLQEGAVSVATGQGSALSVEKVKQLRHKKAWELAAQPGMQLPMNLFMMWMSGDQVGLFSIMMTGMMCRSPITSLLNMSQSFQRLEEGEQLDLLWQKVTYLMLNALGFMLAAWKLKSLGLLPTTSSDWLEFLEHSQVCNLVASLQIFLFVNHSPWSFLKVEFCSTSKKKKLSVSLSLSLSLCYTLS
eukprot:m.46612 g.46612  ORF g.46612 m.46612 type:complete len:213 (+) comp10390_c0_seq1:91-729(+)